MGKRSGSEDGDLKIPDLIKPAIKSVIVVLIAGISLAFNPWGYNLFIIPKLYLLINLTSLLLVLFLVFLIFSGKIYLPPKRVTIMLALFIALLAISTFNSVLPRISFIGKMPRYEGLLTWFFYIVLFYVGYVFIDKDSDRKHIFWAIALATLTISVYGIFQALGFDVVKWRPGLAAGRIRSTLGNPATLGAYLSLVLPFISSQLLQKKTGIKSRFFISVVIISGIAALIMTGSRGAWFGFMIASAFLFFKYYADKRKRLWLVLAVLILSAVFIFTFFKLESKRGTAYGRIILWKQTSKAIIDKPIFGWGAETFQYIFPRYMSKEYEQNVTRKTIIDNAHNLFLHNSVSNGVVSSIALIAFLIMVFQIMYKDADKNKSNGLYLNGVLAGAIGYIISLQFHFSTIAVSSAFWILLGVGLRASRNINNHALFQIKKYYFLIIVGIFSFIFWFFASINTAKAILADMELRSGLAKSVQGEVPETLLRLLQAEKMQPMEEYYALTTGQVLLQVGEKTQSSSLVEAAGEAFKRALELNPLNEYTLLGLADVEYLKWTETGRQEHLTRAKKLYQKILGNDPNFTEVKQKLKRLNFYGLKDL